MYVNTRVLFIIKYLGFSYDYTILDRSYVYTAFVSFLITVFMYKYDVLLLSCANPVCLKSFFSNKLTFAISSFFIKVNKKNCVNNVCVTSSHTYKLNSKAALLSFT